MARGFYVRSTSDTKCDGRNNSRNDLVWMNVYWIENDWWSERYIVWGSEWKVKLKFVVEAREVDWRAVRGPSGPSADAALSVSRRALKCCTVGDDLGVSSRETRLGIVGDSNIARIKCACKIWVLRAVTLHHLKKNNAPALEWFLHKFWCVWVYII